MIYKIGKTFFSSISIFLIGLFITNPIFARDQNGVTLPKEWDRSYSPYSEPSYVDYRPNLGAPRLITGYLPSRFEPNIQFFDENLFTKAKIFDYSSMKQCIASSLGVSCADHRQTWFEEMLFNTRLVSPGVLHTLSIDMLKVTDLKFVVTNFGAPLCVRVFRNEEVTIQCFVEKELSGARGGWKYDEISVPSEMGQALNLRLMFPHAHAQPWEVEARRKHNLSFCGVLNFRAKCWVYNYENEPNAIREDAEFSEKLNNNFGGLKILDIAYDFEVDPNEPIDKGLTSRFCALTLEGNKKSVRCVSVPSSKTEPQGYVTGPLSHPPSQYGPVAILDLPPVVGNKFLTVGYRGTYDISTISIATNKGVRFLSGLELPVDPKNDLVLGDRLICEKGKQINCFNKSHKVLTKLPIPEEIRGKNIQYLTTIDIPGKHVYDSRAICASYSSDVGPWQETSCWRYDGGGDGYMKINSKWLKGSLDDFSKVHLRNTGVAKFNFLFDQGLPLSPSDLPAYSKRGVCINNFQYRQVDSPFPYSLFNSYAYLVNGKVDGKFLPHSVGIAATDDWYRDNDAIVQLLGSSHQEISKLLQNDLNLDVQYIEVQSEGVKNKSFEIRWIYAGNSKVLTELRQTPTHFVTRTTFDWMNRKALREVRLCWFPK